MVARPQSWLRLTDRRGAAVAAAVGIALFLVAWGVLHHGFYERRQIPDTPVYRQYGESVVDGSVPYRDFRVDYPPAALPVFILPALGHPTPRTYGRRFQTLMALCGAALVAFVAVTLLGLEADRRRAAAAVAFAALAPLAIGSLVLSRFDLWPAALTAAALAALVGGRERVGFAVLGLGVAAKLYPALLIPSALAYVWRRLGRREAVVCTAALVGVVALCLVPFLALAPHGVWESFRRQADRPLQLESLGSAFLLAAHQLGGVGLTMRSNGQSQNLAGTSADALALALAVAQAVAVVGVWIAFARGPIERERLVRAAAAAVAVFVALGKVLSPQFLLWLVPLVPLVRGRRGLAASSLLAAALVLTQLWFPYRYWDLALRFDPLASWLVVARDLVLVALAAVLVWAPTRSEREPLRS